MSCLQADPAAKTLFACSHGIPCILLHHNISLRQTIWHICCLSMQRCNPHLLCRPAFSLHVDTDLPLPPGASDDSLQQRYFPPAHSAIGGSLFTHAIPQGSLSRQGWDPVPQDSQQAGHFAHLALHHSAPSTVNYTGGASFSQGLQPPNLFEMTQRERQRSSVFGQGDQQRNQGQFPMGQLEQHYLTHLQPPGHVHGASAGVSGGSSGHRSSLPGHGTHSHAMQSARSNLAWMDPQRQWQRQAGNVARLGQVPTYEPNSQVAMNLDELSALMQIDHSQALPVISSQPAVPPQPPLTLAQSYLSQLRAHALMRAQSSPMLSYAGEPGSNPVYDQGNSYPSWGNMQMHMQIPQLEGLHRMRDPASSASESHHDSHLRASRFGSDTDALNEAMQDDPRHHR